MLKDKLTRDQQIRAEALSQSVAGALGHVTTVKNVLDTAQDYENYIRNGRDK